MAGCLQGMVGLAWGGGVSACSLGVPKSPALPATPRPGWDGWTLYLQRGSVRCGRILCAPHPLALRACGARGEQGSIPRCL